MSIRSLFLSYDGLTDPLGQSQILPYLTGLAELGVAVDILSFEKPENYDARKGQIEAIIAGTRVRWFPEQYTKKPPVLSTFRDLQTMQRRALALHRTHNYTLVHARSYIAGMAAAHLQSKTGVRFLFDIRGFWADERVDGGLWNLRNPLFWALYRYFKGVETKLFNAADHIISLTEAGRDEIQSWAKLKDQPRPVTVVPCCADLRLFSPANIDPARTEALRQELQIDPEQLVLTYLGSLGTWYMRNEMLDFFVELRKTYPQAVFLFITRDNPAEITAAAAERGIPSSALRIRPAERNEVASMLALSHLAIFFILPAYSKKASSPTKQGEMMGMGLPLVCNTGVGDTDRVVRAYNAGALVEAFTPEAYQQVVQDIPRLLALDKNRIMTGAKEWYSLQVGVAKYLEVYQHLAAKSR